MTRIFSASVLLFICAAASLAQDGTKFNVGDTVEAKSYMFNPPWHKGCTPNFDALVDRSDLHPITTISADASDITFLIGAWKIFTPSYPTTVTHGNTIYREYGMGAQSPPLRINADGTYVWYDEFNKPPVKGKWTADAKIEGAKFWTFSANGVVIKDSKGGLWKVYRWKLAGDNEDRISVHTFCSGMSYPGTRIR